VDARSLHSCRQTRDAKKQRPKHTTPISVCRSCVSWTVDYPLNDGGGPESSSAGESWLEMCSCKTAWTVPGQFGTGTSKACSSGGPSSAGADDVSCRWHTIQSNESRRTRSHGRFVRDGIFASFFHCLLNHASVFVYSFPQEQKLAGRRTQQGPSACMHIESRRSLDVTFTHGIWWHAPRHAPRHATARPDPLPRRNLSLPEAA
jgi:hypothetical protein